MNEQLLADLTCEEAMRRVTHFRRLGTVDEIAGAAAFIASEAAAHMFGSNVVIDDDESTAG